MLICTTSSGHYPENFFDIPEELYEKLKTFSKEYPIWSDCEDLDILDKLDEELAPFAIQIPSFCTYA